MGTADSPLTQLNHGKSMPSASPRGRKPPKRRRFVILATAIGIFVFLWIVLTVATYYRILGSSTSSSSSSSVVETNSMSLKQSLAHSKYHHVKPQHQQHQQQVEYNSNVNNTNNTNNGMGIPIKETKESQTKTIRGGGVKTIPNPWLGWAPNRSDETEKDCSWRKCFAEQHPTCQTTCRDQASGENNIPPPVPDNWIPDVTMLSQMRKVGKDANGNPWPPPLSTELCEPMGFSGGRQDDNKQLLDQVPITVVPEGNINKNEQEQQPSSSSSSSLPKVLCMIYTMAQDHDTRVRAIRETWASHCDGFLAFSTESDPRIPAISLPHEGAEEYNNMWQKVRSIWKFVGTHYVHDFDYFFLGGDDLFVIPENLRHYLATSLQDPTTNYYFLGRRFHGYEKSNFFNSGGAGYALSKGTLLQLRQGLEDPKCIPKRHTAMEDVMIAQCLRDMYQISLTDTRDEKGRERFHPFSPGSHLLWKPPLKGKRDWYADYNRDWGIKLGTDCCAPDSVSFHYIKKPAMVRHLYSLLYLCK